MKRMHRIVLGLCIVALMVSTELPAQQKGEITPQLLEQIERSVPMDREMTAMMNAITKNDVKTMALSRDVSISTDTYFSHKIKTMGVTDQKRSGRCWMFAGLNILRPVAAKNINNKKFEFSQTYLFFYDKLEKANLFLESIIDTKDKSLEDREVEWLLKHSMMDGGQWNMVIALIDKYGVVPADVMPETQSSSNSGRVNEMLSKLLIKDASILRSKAASGMDADALRRFKNETMLSDVYRILVLHMGVPPKSFEWRYEDAEGKVTEPKTYTPQQFYKQYVNIDLNDYVCLHSVPLHEYGKAYQVQYDRNLYNIPNMTFVNIPMDQMKELTKKSLLGDDPVWFGCDVGKESDSKLGVMKTGLYDYESIYGIDFSMNRADRIRYGQSIPSHAMVFTGVDIVDGKPVKWLVENSWGTSPGDNGMFAMYDKWYDEYMYSVIINKKYLPKDIISLAQTADAEVLPPWDPLFGFEPR